MVRAELSADKRPFAMWELRKGTREVHRRPRIEQIVYRRLQISKKRKVSINYDS